MHLLVLSKIAFLCGVACYTAVQRFVYTLFAISCLFERTCLSVGLDFSAPSAKSLEKDPLYGGTVSISYHSIYSTYAICLNQFTLLTAQQIHFRRILQCILQFPNNNISLYDLFLTRYFFEKIKLVVYTMCLRSLVCLNRR